MTPGTTRTTRCLARVAIALLFALTARAEMLSFVPKGETQPEPYIVEKPNPYARGRRYPLIIYLHGRGGHTTQWLSPAFAPFRKQAADRGYFVLVPHLGTDHWMNARARRVLDELLLKAFAAYPIDPRRVHVMGMSMGGGAALTYAMHHPQRVRSVCDIFGTTDFVQLYRAGRYAKPLARAFGGTLATAPDAFRAQSAMSHLDAFAKTPVFVLHGDQDACIAVEHSRQFVKAMMAIGYDVVYHEMPGRGHERVLIQGFEDKILDFFDAVTRTGYDPRLAFAKRRTNLARGKPYQYSAVPTYRLTNDNGDLTDLTDGRLSDRRDERIWFERHCVAWHGNPRVNIVIDLGSAQAIGEVAARLLGGREQGGLRFPQRVEVAVSADGTSYRRVGLYRKGTDDATFHVPAEQGKAWVHALRFKDIKARGRYVALKVQPEGTFCAADELFVLASDHPASQDRPGPPTERPLVFPFGPHRYTAYPLKSQWFAADIATWTCIGGYNTLADRKKPVTLVLDLPREVTLTGWMLNERYGGRPAPAPAPSPIQIDGTPCHRYAITTRGLSERFWLYVFWKTTQPPGWSAPARIHATWDGGEQAPATVTFRSVRIPKAPRPKRLHVSLDWMSYTFWARNADTVLDVCQRCGFTAMPYSGMWRPRKDLDLKQALVAAEARGFDIIYNFSPIHAIQAKRKAHPEICCQLPVGKRAHLCPSYRGPLLDEHLDRIAAGFALHPARWVFLDCEVRWSSLEQIAQCATCQKRRRQGESPEDFAARMGRELFGRLRERLEAVRKAAGGPPFQMGSYAVHPSRTRYPVLRFKSLYPDVFDFAMPSIYTIRPGAVRERVAADRAELDHDAVIPWLQPGTTGEKPAAALYEEALGCLLAGGMGLTYYTHHGFDAADFAAVARAVAVAAAYEQIVVAGKPIAKWTTAAEDIAACGKQKGSQAIWMVVSEADKPRDVALPRPKGVGGHVVELSVADGNLARRKMSAARVRLSPGDVRVFATSE